jgi:hypothetical protein
MLKRTLFLAVLFAFLASPSLQAQQFSEKQIREWEKKPLWIAMLDDSTANYFEVVAAFETFWKDREMPVEEKEVLGAGRDDRGDSGFLKRLFRSGEKEARKEKAMRSNYQFEVKRYKHWKLLVQPWIQEDGSIVPPSEQKAIWRNARK